MCGIIGYVSRASCPQLERGLDLLAHRGPDGRGEFSGSSADTRFWLGHRRLSIIDLSGGTQPFEKHGLAVTFNGEIYNYVELAADLEREYQVSFRTRSDTEVLLEAYRVWGTRCLERLNGMFAFCIVDTQTASAFCARDRMGKKPFYYISRHDGFYFASEPGPLLPLLARRIADTQSLLGYLLGAHIPPGRSFFAGIEQLPPGHYLTTRRPGQVEIRRYWSPRVSLTDLPYEEAREELAKTLHQAVAVRTRSDVGFAVAASAGLDSSIVLATAAEHGPVNTVSLVFDHAFDSDETEYIERLPQFFTMRPNYVRASPTLGLEELLSMARRTVALIEEPTPYTSVPFVAKLYEGVARAGFKVLMEGQGADELFAGYSYFRAFQRGALLRGWAGSRDALLSLKTHSAMTRAAFYIASTFYPFLSKQAREQVQLPATASNINDALLLAQEDLILPALLQYSDRLSMRFGVEVRLPFLDVEVVELANSLPAKYKVLGVTSKRVLRDAFATRLPNFVVDRPKVGFGNPAFDLLSRHSTTLIEKYVRRGRVTNSALFRHGSLSALHGAFMRMLPNAERVLWRFIIANMWLEHFAVEVEQA